MGLFGIREDHIEKDQSLDEMLITNRASTFFFRLSGDSMAPLFYDQDILVVDRSLPPKHNHIVVASVDQELYCRRLIHSKGHSPCLRAENPEQADLNLDHEEGLDVVIFGVVTSMVREFPYGR